jgi:hypothetical protein
LAGIIEVISYAKKALTKLSEKRENKERLASALLALETLERELQQLMKLGQEVSEIIQAAKEEPTITDAQKLYAKLPEILDMINEIHSSFYELCREANVISKLAFMDEVQRTDRRAHDVISFLGRFYCNGKINLRDLPMFISFFGPQRNQSKKIKKIATEKLAEIRPVLERA